VLYTNSVVTDTQYRLAAAQAAVEEQLSLLHNEMTCPFGQVLF